MVAVTGIHGALGGALLPRLEDDERYERVVLLDAQAPRRMPSRSVFHQVDLTEPLADDLIAAVLRSEQVEVMVHLALREAPIPLTTSAHELETVGTLYVLNAAASCIDRGSPLRALVTVTTAMVYGANARNPAYLCEDQPLRGAAHAGFVADKVDVETQLEDFRRSFHLPVCVLRPCWSVGSATSIAARLLTLRPCVTVLGFDPLMQLLHHDDLVAVLKQAIDDPRDGAFNVAGAGVLPLRPCCAPRGACRWPSRGRSRTRPPICCGARTASVPVCRSTSSATCGRSTRSGHARRSVSRRATRRATSPTARALVVERRACASGACLSPPTRRRVLVRASDGR